MEGTSNGPPPHLPSKDAFLRIPPPSLGVEEANQAGAGGQGWEEDAEDPYSEVTGRFVPHPAPGAWMEL
jgi:hypothetical protein